MKIEEARQAVINSRRPSAFIRTLISTSLGLALGFGSLAVYDAVKKPPAFTLMSAPKLVPMGNYVGIEIDRTRTSYCELHPSRIMFMTNSDNIPIVYPIPTFGFTWPHLGHVKLIVLVSIPKDLPPGRWQIQSIAYDDCNWYNIVFGDRMIISQPISITIGDQSK